MRSPRKVRRIEKQYAQNNRAVPINIVSMIDIFAILVFYLLVSIAAVEMRPTDATLQLPKSTAQKRPEEATQVMVTTKQILVDNHVVMELTDAEAATTPDLPALNAQLQSSAELKLVEGDASRRTRGEVNILADKTIPYSVLKKVMASCSKAEFARISLAVVERKGGQP